jgi:hypothetical protein
MQPMIRMIMLMLLLLMACTDMMAQEFSVSGKIFSGEDQSPLPGVNILKKGTTT